MRFILLFVFIFDFTQCAVACPTLLTFTPVYLFFRFHGKTKTCIALLRFMGARCTSTTRTRWSRESTSANRVTAYVLEARCVGCTQHDIRTYSQHGKGHVLLVGMMPVHQLMALHEIDTCNRKHLLLNYNRGRCILHGVLSASVFIIV